MKNNPLIALVQMNVVSDPAKNLTHADEFIKEAASAQADMAILPEMWFTGLNWEATDHVVERCWDALSFMQQASMQYQMVIAGSLPFKEDAAFVNRLFVCTPTADETAWYDKMHLFAPFGEKESTTAGQRCIAVDCGEAGIWGCSICYDIRFPELYRSYALSGVDGCLVSSAFPSARRDHWTTLVRARAMENQMLMVACNRVGREIMRNGIDVTFGGASLLVNTDGSIIVQGPDNEEAVVLGCCPLRESRKPSSYDVLGDISPCGYVC